MINTIEMARGVRGAGVLGVHGDGNSLGVRGLIRLTQPITGQYLVRLAQPITGQYLVRLAQPITDQYLVRLAQPTTGQYFVRLAQPITGQYLEACFSGTGMLAL